MIIKINLVSRLEEDTVKTDEEGDLTVTSTSKFIKSPTGYFDLTECIGLSPLAPEEAVELHPAKTLLMAKGGTSYLISQDIDYLLPLWKKARKINFSAN